MRKESIVVNTLLLFMKPRTFFVVPTVVTEQDINEDFQPRSAQMLGSSIHDQRYTGITGGATGLLHGQYDDPDCDTVDPLCDFDVDRFGLRSEVPTSPSASQPDSPDTN